MDGHTTLSVPFTSICTDVNAGERSKEVLRFTASQNKNLMNSDLQICIVFVLTYKNFKSAGLLRCIKEIVYFIFIIIISSTLNRSV